MKAEARKQQILQAAKKVFAKHGYHNANISMICQKAGIGRGTLYEYFQNKKAVFTSILEDKLDLIDRELNYNNGSRPQITNSTELTEFLADRMEKALAVFLEDKDFARIMLTKSGDESKKLNKVERTIAGDFLSHIKKDLEMGQRLGFISSEINPELAAVKVWGGIEKIFIHYFLTWGQTLDRNNAKELINQMVTIDLYGLVSRDKMNNLDKTTS